MRKRLTIGRRGLGLLLGLIGFTAPSVARAADFYWIAAGGAGVSDQPKLNGDSSNLSSQRRMSMPEKCCGDVLASNSRRMERVRVSKCLLGILISTIPGCS